MTNNFATSTQDPYGPPDDAPDLVQGKWVILGGRRTVGYRSIGQLVYTAFARAAAGIVGRSCRQRK